MRRMRIRYAVPALAALATVVPVTLALAAGPGAPTVTVGAASGIGENGATLKGTVDPDGLATKYAFQYGTRRSYGEETTVTSAGSGSSALDETATLAGLAAGTTYHYRIIAINADGTAVSTPDETFKTSGTATATTTPAAVTGAVSDVSGTSAQVSGVVDPDGTATTYMFEYGPTADYGFETGSASAGSGTTAVPEATTLTGLEPSTLYHYAIVAVTNGHAVVGNDGTFTTENESVVKLIGREGFVSPGNVVGAEVICVDGMTSCDGTITFTTNGKTIASGKLSREAESGGFQNLKLNSTGVADLKSERAHGHLLGTTIKIVTTGGETVQGTINLARWSY